MDLNDLTPRTIDAELAWFRNTSEGTENSGGVHRARISWPIKRDEIERLAPHRSDVAKRYKLWPGSQFGTLAPKIWHYVNIYVYDEDNSRQLIGSVSNGYDPV